MPGDLIPEESKAELANSLIDLLKSFTSLVSTAASLPRNISEGIQDIYSRFFTVPYVEGATMTVHAEDFNYETYTSQSARDEQRDYANKVLALLYAQKNKITELRTACQSAFKALKLENDDRAMRLRNKQLTYERLVKERDQLRRQNIQGGHIEERAGVVRDGVTRLRERLEENKRILARARANHDERKIKMYEDRIKALEQVISTCNSSYPRVAGEENTARLQRVLPGNTMTMANYDADIATTLREVTDIKNEKSYIPNDLVTFLFNNGYINDSLATTYKKTAAPYTEIMDIVTTVDNTATSSMKEVDKGIYACTVVLGRFDREDQRERQRNTVRNATNG